MSSDLKDLKVLFDHHYQNLCFFVYTLTHDQVLAEDVVQDAFISLHHNLDSLPPEEKVYKSFLYTTARNSVLNLHRRNNVVKKYHARMPFVDIQEGDFDNAIIKTEVLAEINKIIENLPASCQNIMRMHYVLGLSVKEISEQLNISPNTVKTQKLRGLRYIKSKLNPEFFILLLLFI